MQAANTSLTAVMQQPSSPLQASNSTFLASTFLGTLVLDSKADVRFCSNTLAQHIGIAASELIGCPVRMVLPDLPLTAATEGYNVAFGAFSGAGRRRQPSSLRKPDGSLLAVDAHIVMLKMNSGYLFCLELHHACRTANATHDGKQTDSIAGIVALRRAGGFIRITLDRQYRIGFASSSIEELLGFDYEEIVGVHISSLLPDLLPQLGAYHAAKRSKQCQQAADSLDLYACHADGRHIPALVTPLNDPCEAILPLLLRLPYD